MDDTDFGDASAMVLEKAVLDLSSFTAFSPDHHALPPPLLPLGVFLPCSVVSLVRLELPDGDTSLELVDKERDALEGVPPMGTRAGQDDASVADWAVTEDMDSGDFPDRVPFEGPDAELPQLLLGHRDVTLITEFLYLLPVEVVAGDPDERGNRPAGWVSNETHALVQAGKIFRNADEEVLADGRLVVPGARREAQDVEVGRGGGRRVDHVDGRDLGVPSVASRVLRFPGVVPDDAACTRPSDFSWA